MAGDQGEAPTALEAIVVDDVDSLEAQTGAVRAMAARGLAVFRRAPEVAFHVALFLVFIIVAIAFSWPGTHFLILFVSIPLVLALVAVWVVRLGTYTLALVRNRAEGRARHFLIAPVAGVLLLVMLYAAVPLRVRWFFSKGDFERALELAPPPTRPGRSEAFDVPSRIGSYQVTWARRQGDAVIFDDAEGSFLDDAGFAYLPTGPFPQLSTGSFENPRFRSLGGHWYAWTASW